MKTKLIFFAVALLATAIAAAGAIAGGFTRDSLADPGSEPPAASVAREFPTFGAPPSRPDNIAELRELKSQFATAPPGSPISATDFTLARVVPIGGSDEDAWIAPSGEHICIFIPDPVDGYGAGCVTTDDIADGHGFSFLSGAKNARIVALLPQGDSEPKVSSKTAPDADLQVTGNASAGILPTDAVIVTDHVRIELSPSAAQLKDRAP